MLANEAVSKLLGLAQRRILRAHTQAVRKATVHSDTDAKLVGSHRESDPASLVGSVLASVHTRIVCRTLSFLQHCKMVRRQKKSEQLNSVPEKQVFFFFFGGGSVVG